MHLFHHRSPQLCFGALTLLLSLAGVPASAQIYDVAKDFTIGQNPNGVWSYGYSTALAAPFTLYTKRGPVNLIEGSNFTTLSAWTTDIDPYLGVYENTTHQAFNGTTTYGVGELALQPGSNSQYSEIIWTSPSTGWYKLDAIFRLNSIGQTDAHLFVGNTEVVNALLSSKGDTAPYTPSLMKLAAGDTITFAVGDGGNGPSYDTTGLSAQIRNIHIASDLNQDGQSDLVWQDQTTGDVSYWFLNGAQQETASGYLVRAIPLEWQVVGTPDLNGDGSPDLLWQDENTGDISYWFMNGTQFVSGAYIARNIPLEWKIVGTPDLNGDGMPDLLWQNQQTGDVSYWIMNGTQFVSSGYIANGISLEWKIVGTADLNGDGSPDLIWRNQLTGDVSYWILRDRQFLSGGYIAYGVPLDWKLVRALDLNGDTMPDLLWQNQQTGDVSYWLMNNTQFVSSGYLAHNIPLEWQMTPAD